MHIVDLNAPILGYAVNSQKRRRDDDNVDIEIAKKFHSSRIFWAHEICIRTSFKPGDRKGGLEGV